MFKLIRSLFVNGQLVKERVDTQTPRELELTLEALASGYDDRVTITTNKKGNTVFNALMLIGKERIACRIECSRVL